MNDVIEVDGVAYLSSRKAASNLGYTQDYVGQLLRKGSIQGKRIGNHWYVVEDSLKQHKEKADAYVPVPPGVYPLERPHSLISFDGNEYISASRASEETGYNHDYITQLARSGKILSRQVGNRWFLHRKGLLSHKKEKDALLAAVQASSVGLVRLPEGTSAVHQTLDTIPETRYFHEDAPLIPTIQPSTLQKNTHDLQENLGTSHVPIRKVQAESGSKKRLKPLEHGKARKTNVYMNVSSYALTIMLLLSVGVYSFRDHSTLVQSAGQTGIQTAAAASSSFIPVLNLIESLVTYEVTYTRSR
ncbi:hypothetical protein EBR66_00870 [bacterium]|nr:hypothetical protein [bacterium]